MYVVALPAAEEHEEVLPVPAKRHEQHARAVSSPPGNFRSVWSTARFCDICIVLRAHERLAYKYGADALFDVSLDVLGFLDTAKSAQDDIPLAHHVGEAARGAHIDVERP